MPVAHGCGNSEGLHLALPQEAAGLKTTDHGANGQACCLEPLTSCANEGLIRGWLGLLWLLANVLGLVC